MIQAEIEDIFLLLLDKSWPINTWDGRKSLHIGGVGGDIIEDVDEHEEDGDKERHPARNNLWRNEEPGLEFMISFPALKISNFVVHPPMRLWQTGRTASSSWPDIWESSSSASSQSPWGNSSRWIARQTESRHPHSRLSILYFVKWNNFANFVKLKIADKVT